MRSLRFALAAASLIATTAFASPTAPTSGVEYLTMSAAQPVPAAKKVEVIEFFMYQCPHCNVLEPYLHDWVKKQGDNIIFKRVHFAQSANDPIAHLYLTLEAMGKGEEMNPKVFRAIHTERIRMNKEEVVFDWVAKNGIDKAKFMEYWNSFSVLTKLKRTNQVVSNYKVDSAPTLVVNGQYMTSPSIVGAKNPNTPETELSKATVQVLDALVAKVQKDKGWKPAAAAPAAPKTASK